MPSRRAYLATLAASGLSGCTDTRSGVDPSEGSPTPQSPAEPAGVDVVDASIAYSVRHVLHVDHTGVYTVDGAQFVFVTVDDTGGSAHSRSEFSLVADGEQFPATTFAEGEPHDLGSGQRAYRRGSDPFRSARTGWVCFVVPDRLDATPTLRLDSEVGAWEWSLDSLDRATMPPPEWEFSVTAPDTVSPNATFEIGVTATNVGDGPGRFRAAVNFENVSAHTETVGLPLAPGDSGTEAVEAESGEVGERFTYDVRTAAGDSELAVAMVAESGAASDSATPTPTTTESG